MQIPKTAETSPEPEDLDVLLSRYRDELRQVRHERDEELAALANTERQLSETQRRWGVGTWERRLDTNEISWSAETYRIMGFDPGSVTPNYRLFIELVHEDDRDRLLAAIKDEQDWTKPLEFTYRIRRPDGAVRTVHSRSVFEVDGENRAVRQFGTIRDVTQGRALEAGTSGNETSSLPPVVFMMLCDESGRITYANPAFERLSDAFRIGQVLREDGPDPFGPLQKAIASVQRSGKAVNTEFCHLDEELGMRAFETVVEPILTENAVSGFSVFALPKAGAAGFDRIQQESARSLSDALRIANLGHWEKDLTTQTSRYSDTSYRILGVDRETFEATTENFLSLIHPDDVALTSGALKNLYENGEPSDFEFRIIRPDGETRHLLAQGERIETDEGHLKAIGTVLDVTDRHLVLDSLRQSNLRAEALAEEMRRSYDQLLRLSRLMTKIQEEERRRIALDLHDEAGALLTGLQLTVQLLAREKGLPEEHINRAERLVDDLVDRIENVTRRLRPSSLDQLGLRSTLLAYFAEFQDRHGIVLDVSLDIEHEGEIAEDTRIAAYRIVQEGLTNVARHAFVESASVVVRQKKKTLDIVVQDRGVGIDPTDVDADGTIGVSGMRKRATLLGGSLDLESSPGKGVRLSVRLPI